MKTPLQFAGTALKNMFSKPVTIDYPEKPYDYPEATRGHVEIDFDNCILCSMCARVCPPRAIDVDKRSGNWILSRFDCIQCGYCVEKCPKNCLKIVPGYTKPRGSKVQTIMHKEVEKRVPQMDATLCVYCTLCAKKCPVQALTVDRKEKVWQLDETLCIACGLCEHNCPKKCIEMMTPLEAEARRKKTAAILEQRQKVLAKSAETSARSAAEASETGAAEEAKHGIVYPKYDPDKCVYCTLCAKNCPEQALTVDRKEKLWRVNTDRCIACGLCLNNCPKNCITMEGAGKTEEKLVEAVKKAEEEIHGSFPQMNPEVCVYCTLCAKKCPVGALTVDRKEKKWELDRHLCLSCGACTDNCPKKCIEMKDV